MTAPATERVHTPAWRAGFTTILAVAMATGTLSQFAFAVLAPFLIDEFEITRFQLGMLTTAMFAIGALGSLPTGRLVDRFGGRRVLVASMAIVTVAILGMATAPAFPVMVIGAAIVGCSLAAGNPTTNKLVAVHIPPGQRGVIMGVKQAGVQVAGFVVGASLPTLAGATDWRVALALMGIVPIVGIGAALWIVPRDKGAESRLDRRPPAFDALKPVVRTTAIYGFLMGLGVAATSAYLPLYAEERIGMPVTTAGLVAATMGGVGIFSRVLWGWATERRGRFFLPMAVLGVGSVTATLLVMLAEPAGAGWLWMAAVLYGATAITWNSVGMLLVLAEVGTEEAGRASGWVLLGFYGGFAVSPTLFGYSVDASGSYILGWSGVTVIFAVAAALAWMWYRRRARARKAAAAQRQENLSGS
jgi:predicted MFS family arabinose efflux permease